MDREFVFSLFIDKSNSTFPITYHTVTGFVEIIELGSLFKTSVTSMPKEHILTSDIKLAGVF